MSSGTPSWVILMTSTFHPRATFFYRGWNLPENCFLAIFPVISIRYDKKCSKENLFYAKFSKTFILTKYLHFFFCLGAREYQRTIPFSIQVIEKTILLLTKTGWDLILDKIVWAKKCSSLNLQQKVCNKILSWSHWES